MTRFAVVYEDPSYEYQEDVMDWVDQEIEHSELSNIVDSWIRNTVAKKPQEEMSPFITVNS
jgi:hypothetical protein